jgi:universal stress protein A
MKIKRILCPIDFSEFSMTANHYASLLAKATGAEIIYLHSIDSNLPYVGFCNLDASKDHPEELRSLQEVHPTSENIKCSYVLCQGGAADAILDYARNEDVDLIVMGTHGRTGMHRVLMGSVAEAVVRHARCSVLTSKQPWDSSKST